jgi:hypothetical protein
MKSKKIPYYSNSILEVIFQSLPHMIVDENYNTRSKIIQTNLIHIIFSESDRDYNPWTFPCILFLF